MFKIEVYHYVDTLQGNGITNIILTWILSSILGRNKCVCTEVYHWEAVSSTEHHLGV